MMHARGGVRHIPCAFCPAPATPAVEAEPNPIRAALVRLATQQLAHRPAPDAIINAHIDGMQAMDAAETEARGIDAQIDARRDSDRAAAA